MEIQEYKYRYLYLYKVISPPPSAKKNISITVSENLNTMDKHTVHNYTCMYNDLKIRHSSLYVTCIILRYLSETPSMQPPHP